MKYPSSSFPKSFFGILHIIGLDFALTTMRWASTIFLSSAPVLFSRALLTNPRTVGAVCPSSSRLARAIANQVTLPGKDELILELGGGTGMVTRALLRRGGRTGQTSGGGAKQTPGSASEKTVSESCCNPWQCGKALPVVQ